MSPTTIRNMLLMFMFVVITVSVFYIKKINANLDFAEKQVLILEEDIKRQADLYAEAKKLEKKLDEIYVTRAKEVENLSKDASAVQQEVARILKQRENGENKNTSPDASGPDPDVVRMLDDYCTKVNGGECSTPQ